MTHATEQAPRNLTPAELATLVRAFRDMRSWSQEQLAEIARLTTRTVQRVEGGEPSSVDTRRALAAAFGFEDIDAFNKPYVIPTPEEAAAAKERFDKDHVTLKLEPVDSGKQLASLLQNTHACLFSECAELTGAAEEAFAALSDYSREYADSWELYSAIDRLGVHDELDSYLVTLHSGGFCLAAAKRSGHFRGQGSAPGLDLDILYVVAGRKDAVPANLAVPRQVRFG